MRRKLEAERWFKQSLRDLKAAKDSLRCENFEWSCFQAHQAAEKAIKALLHGLGRGAWGRSVTELLGHLEHTYSVEQLLTKARELDRHYIPSRYPNVYESGYPGMYYDHETAERAIRCAEDIINWVRERLREIGVKT